jgi:hypothetical protein
MSKNTVLANGHALEDALTANAEVPEVISGPTPSQDKLPVFSNWEPVESADGKIRRRGLPLPVICEELASLFHGWPKRVGNLLFVPGANFEPRFIETAPQLFAYFDRDAFVDWGRGSDMISPERFLAHLQESAENFDAVERFPHFPPLPNTYYFYPHMPESSGEHLNEFVNFFRPYLDVDRQLIKAFIMLLAWGGPPGSRPAWLFVAPDDDKHGGRGVGKSACIELCAAVVGGMLEISPNEDIIAIKKRLLSPASRTLRVARIDNIKSYRFSWADLEGLITSPVISGHRLYRGEGRRPNSLVWTLTLNGASLSKDLAKRTVVVTLRRPPYSPTWADDVRGYINEYRWHILSDIQASLES